MSSKLMVSQSRFLNIQGKALTFAQIPESSYVAFNVPPPKNLPMSTFSYNGSLNIFDNKSYTSNDSFLSLTSLCLRVLDVNKNDIVKNHCPSGGHLEFLGLRLPLVKETNNQAVLKRVLIRENLVQECTGGAAGIEVARGTCCQMENNEVVKGETDGIRITGSDEGMQGNSALVCIMNTLCKENGGNGVLMRGLKEGMVVMQDCIMSLNTKNGI